MMRIIGGLRWETNLKAARAGPCVNLRLFSPSQARGSEEWGAKESQVVAKAPGISSPGLAEVQLMSEQGQMSSKLQTDLDRLAARGFRTTSSSSKVGRLWDWSRDRLEPVWCATPMPRPRLVAMAAPSTPRAGTGPQPNMSSGSSAMLIRLAIQRARMAIAASPAPRKMALIRKRSMTVMFPPASKL